MIKLLLFILVSQIFTDKYQVETLNGTIYNFKDLEKYDVIVFYDEPCCSSCISSLKSLIDYYDVTNFAVVSLMPNTSFIMQKSRQQSIKKQFGISMKDIYFDLSVEQEIAMFFKFGENNVGLKKMPVILVKDLNDNFIYYSYSELFNDRYNSGLNRVFKKYFEASK